MATGQDRLEAPAPADSSTAPGVPPDFAGQPALWNRRWLGVSLVLGLVGQAVFLPCLCAQGEAKMLFAAVLDLLWGLRVGLACYRQERGRGWVFYALLILTSPLWINLLFMTLDWWI